MQNKRLMSSKILRNLNLCEQKVKNNTTEKEKKKPRLLDPRIGYASCFSTASAGNIYFKITAEAVLTSLKYQISLGSNRVGVFYGHKWATTESVFGKHTFGNLYSHPSFKFQVR